MRAPESGTFRSALSVVYRSALGAALTLALAIPASAQQNSVRVAGGAFFEGYRFSEAAEVGTESALLLTTPYAARITVASRVRLTVDGAFASGVVTDSDGNEYRLEGVNDTRALLEIDIVPDGLTLAGMFIASTGQSTHDLEQAVVAGTVAADLLPFRITNWGSGGGVGVQLSGATRFSPAFGAGVSVSYRQAGEFEPVSGNELVYRPGNQLQARLALDLNTGGGTKTSFVFGFHDFTEDELDGENLFQTGRRLEATGTFAFPVGFRGSGALYGSLLHRENGQFLVATTNDPPSQDLLLFGGLLRQAGLGGWVTPRVDVRAFRSADGLGQGFVAGFGIGVEWHSGSTVWMPTVTGRYGRIEVSEGNESPIVGFEAGMNVRLGR